jgi:predicted HicB family RNase H-like nuclease
MKAKKMGRPRLPKRHVRSAKLSLRMTATLRKAVEKQAKRENKSLGTYVANVLQAQIERSE